MNQETNTINGNPKGFNSDTYKSLKLGNRVINVRNWKVRDRIKLKDLLKDAPSEKRQQEIILDRKSVV